MTAGAVFVRNVMPAFTPFPALLGGAALGLSVAVQALVLGRVTGVSGHLNRTLRRERPSDGLLLAGLALGGMLATTRVAVPPAVVPLPMLPARLLAAGALVAAGATLGSGCTSGHALCGVARLSPRSLVAAPIFVAVATASSRLTETVQTFVQAAKESAVATGAAAAADPTAFTTPFLGPAQLIPAFLVVLALQAVGILVIKKAKNQAIHTWAARALQILIGVGFALGLVCSGMSVPLKVASFFEFLRPTWDPSLLLVFPGALLFASLAFRAVQNGKSRVLLPEKHSLPAIGPIDAKLIAGAVIFGCGWGLAGVCPGPAIVLLGSAVRFPALLPSILTWLGGYIVGLAGLSTVTRYLRI